jgi:hypothetical protein
MRPLIWEMLLLTLWISRLEWEALAEVVLDWEELILKLERGLIYSIAPIL